MKNKKSPQLQDTLLGLQKAFSEWESIPNQVGPEVEDIRKKTRELVKKLSEQIKALDL